MIIKSHRKTFDFEFIDPDLYQQVLSTFRSIHKERFYARIDWSAGAEIIAIVLTFIAHIFSIILAFAQLN